MSGPLFYELSSCIVGTVMEFLAFDHMVQQEHISRLVFTDTAAILLHTLMVFVFCYFAEKCAAHSFQIVDLVYCDLLWYNLPVYEQKLVILPMSRAQIKFRLDGFGIFDATMETFSKAMKYKTFGKIS